jgi:SAM-dependent methyltransferase
MHRPLYDQLVPYYEVVEGRDWAAELRLIVSILREHESKTVLDLGCGTGFHVRALAKHGFDATGVDVSRRNILFARKRAAEEHVHPRFVVGSYYEYRPHELVDAALCLNWSIPTRDDELRRFLRNTRLLLRTGGFLIVDYERVSDIVWKDVGKPIVNSWRIKGLVIVRVSLGNMVSNVLHSTDAYILYSNRNPSRAPDEVARYRAPRSAALARTYVDSSYVRFFSISELRRFAVESGFKLAANHVLPRNGYKRNYAVLVKTS